MSQYYTHTGCIRDHEPVSRWQSHTELSGFRREVHQMGRCGEPAALQSRVRPIPSSEGTTSLQLLSKAA